MIVVVAPEPAPWIAPLVAALAAHERVEVWAPWAVDAAWGALPAGLGRFARLRRMEGARTQPGWALIAVPARWWAGERVDRRHAVDVSERALVDRWAARRLARAVVAPRVVIACSGAAQHTLAIAAGRGARTALVADRPWLRRLHEDLDRAAVALPERAFLRRFRAPRAAIVRQEMERAQADVIAVRGEYARSICVDGGVAPARVVALGLGLGLGEARVAGPGAAPMGGTLVLAGLACARNGLDAALAAMAAHGAPLRVRVGDGTEPADVLARPGVVTMRGDPFADALAVLAPAWCESYAPEVAAARARGVPVIATDAAAGFGATLRVPPGDGAALAAAIARVRAGEVGLASAPIATLAAAIARA